jgi:hypothetical protein
MNIYDIIANRKQLSTANKYDLEDIFKVNEVAKRFKEN